MSTAGNTVPSVFAYCAASFEWTVKRASGVAPKMSPPLTMDSFTPSLMEGYEFLYFKLHGMPGQPFWYGDDGVTAISAHQIAEANLVGAVVFVANCHLPESPMLKALLGAGASAVIGGPGENYAGVQTIMGADLLGMYVRYLWQLGADAQRALRWAKLRLRLKWPSKATKDTLSFQLYTKGARHA
ncbi:MAG: hypothetical protein ABIH46_07860 [Chloroflexota bacterium]